MIARLLSLSLFVSSAAGAVGCKKTGDSDRPTQPGTVAQTQTATPEKRESAPETQPESQPESASSPTEHADIGPGSWAYSHSIGTPGETPGQFREPVGLGVTPDGELFVSDAGNERMQKLSPTGESLAVFAEGVGRPMHVSRSSEGQLAVAVFLEDRIRLFDDTKEVGSFGGGWLDAPAAAVRASDGRYYVADFYHHQFHLVSPDGVRQKTFGSNGGGDGEFTYPTDVALDGDGNVWIADAYAHRLQKFTPDGEHLATIGGRGEAPGRFRIATGVDVGPDGSIYVADFDNDRVQVLAPDGTPAAILESDGDGDRSMKRPTDVVATKNRLYVVDHGHHQVDVWERP